MAIELKLDEKKWYAALGLGLFIGALLAGGAQYAWIRGMNDEIARKRVELKGLQEEIQKGRNAERKLAQFREEVKRLELELSKLLQILPSSRNTEELIKRIETLTRQGDFTLRRFTPAEPISKEFYAEYPIDIQLDGTYHNLALLFDRMSRFSRIINVEDLKINGMDQPGRSIGAQFVAKTFIYTGDEGTAGAPKPGAKPGSPGAAGSAKKLKSRAEGGKETE